MKSTRWFTVLACLGVALGAGSASEGCTTTASVSSGEDASSTLPPAQGDDSGSATATQEDAGSTPPSACLVCLYGDCSGAYSDCVNDASCLAIYQCTAAACPSDPASCAATCESGKSAESVALYDDLNACDLASECGGGACAASCSASAGECAADDGGTGAVGDAASGDAGPDAPPTTCAACQSADCGNQLANCGPSTACAAYNTCVLGCGTTDCVTLCASNDPEGVQAATALGTCTANECPMCAQ